MGEFGLKTISLLEFFRLTKYNWKNDIAAIEHICYYTKTREDPNVSDFIFTYGMEQPFVIKALADYFKPSSFFEMGTGRGTASYSIALSKSVTEIVTVDLLEPKQKRITAIGYKRQNVSNRDIYNKIQTPGKDKIKFKVRKPFIKKESKNIKSYFDMCFIDGEHDNKIVIKQDIDLCRNICKDNAIYIFDDYCINKFGVKSVVDEFLDVNKNYNALLIEMRGHLFGEKREQNEGVIIMSKGGLI